MTYRSGGVNVARIAGPVCGVAAPGALVASPPNAPATVYLGGPDVFPGAGLAVRPGTTVHVPGEVPTATGTAVPLVLYACADREVDNITWLSTVEMP